MKTAGAINIANAITAFRLILAAPIAYFISKGQIVEAAMTYSLFLLLDVADGYAARRFKCETVFGKNFDFISDGIVGAVALAVLLFKGLIPIIYIVLLVIPMAAKSVYIAKSVKINKKSFVAARWSKLNGVVLLLIPLMFIIAHPFAVLIAYIFLIYVYVSSIKYIIEIRGLKRK